jgi:hypothetical protein
MIRPCVPGPIGPLSLDCPSRDPALLKSSLSAPGQRWDLRQVYFPTAKSEDPGSLRVRHLRVFKAKYCTWGHDHSQTHRRLFAAARHALKWPVIFWFWTDFAPRFLHPFLLGYGPFLSHAHQPATNSTSQSRWSNRRSRLNYYAHTAATLEGQRDADQTRWQRLADYLWGVAKRPEEFATSPPLKPNRSAPVGFGNESRTEAI